MHLRGKAFKYEAVLPGGETQVLLDIPRYDFNWQLSYRLTEPLNLPAGSVIRATAWYDNSSGNLANPDPMRTVRWGQQTFDEMMIGYIEYHMEEGSLGRGGVLAGLREQISSGKGFELIFKRLDTNSDGKISDNELPEGQKERLLKLDTNRDGTISLDEAKRLTQFRN